MAAQADGCSVTVERADLAKPAKRAGQAEQLGCCLASAVPAGSAAAPA